MERENLALHVLKVFSGCNATEINAANSELDKVKELPSHKGKATGARYRQSNSPSLNQFSLCRLIYDAQVTLKQK